MDQQDECDSKGGLKEEAEMEPVRSITTVQSSFLGEYL